MYKASEIKSSTLINGEKYDDDSFQFFITLFFLLSFHTSPSLFLYYLALAMNPFMCDTRKYS